MKHNNLMSNELGANFHRQGDYEDDDLSVSPSSSLSD